MIIDAGEVFVLHAPDDFSVESTDGVEIFASCDIGTCEKDAEGNFMWRFQSDTPGSYMVELIFYNIRGGYAVMEFTVEVKP
ncbi:MAG: hypothetical protein ACMUIM_07435 [bacterium]